MSQHLDTRTPGPDTPNNIAAFPNDLKSDTQLGLITDVYQSQKVKAHLRTTILPQPMCTVGQLFQSRPATGVECHSSADSGETSPVHEANLDALNVLSREWRSYAFLILPEHLLFS